MEDVRAPRTSSIFDGSQASLAQWTHDGDGGFELLDDGSGGIGPTPSGGLGMLWYPVKPTATSGSSCEFREGREDGGFSNGGVFVRFPDPRDAGRRAAAVRPHGQRRRTRRSGWPSSAATRSSSTTGRPARTRKTGLDLHVRQQRHRRRSARRRRSASGTTTRSRSSARHYRVFRNGELIKEYDNSPDKTSDRAGDPPASQRQFAQGYIGLQNHGGADRMRVPQHPRRGPLPDAPRRAARPAPFRVDGRRPAHGRGPLGRRRRQRRGEEGPRLRDRRGRAARAARASRSPPVPPMTDTPASAAFGERRLARAGQAVRQARPHRAGGLHGRDGGHGDAEAEQALRALAQGRQAHGEGGARCGATAPHTAKVKLKPSKSLKRKLDAWRKRGSGARSLKLTLTVKMTDLGQPTPDAEEDASRSAA